MRRVNYVPFNDKTSQPYVGPIGHELTPGLEIEVNAFIIPTARRFAVNLQCGPNISPRDDVALHFSPDFDRMMVIRNNILMNSWGPEEITGSFPFIKGQHCRICIRFESEMFRIKVDEHDLTTFIHRIPPTRITHIAIDGDINLSSIEVRIAPGGAPSGLYPSAPYPTNVGFNTNPPYPQSGQPPYPIGGQPPYPTGGSLPYPTQGSAPYINGPPAYPTGPLPGNAYSSGRTSPYVVQPPMSSGGYPTQPGYMPHSPNPSYHGGAAPYPQQPGMPPGVQYPSSPGHTKNKGIMDKTGAFLGTMAAGGLVGGMLKHGGKKISKKKALKYGLPIGAGVAGAGLGAYALKKAFKHGSGSSSSSSSSGSWSD